MKPSYLLLCLSLALTAASYSATLFVTSGQSIQAAINRALVGDTIQVGAGTYNERINFNSKEITLISATGPRSTTIHGGGGGTTVGISGKATISGFTITGGRESIGAGMSVGGIGTRITNNIFTGNTQGGGGFGAAIGGNSASPIIVGNIFTNNSSDSQFLSGAVSFVNGSSPVIQNNLFFNNQGRGLNLTLPTGNAPVVSNNVFWGNTSAIRLDARVDTAAVTFQNNIIGGNRIGFEVDFHSASQGLATWRNNLMYDNTAGYSGISSLTHAYGNIEGNPLFADLAGGDFRLLMGSPAIDAGTNIGSPAFDFDGRLRLLDGNFDGNFVTDIGAFEFVPEPGPIVLLGVSAILASVCRRRRSRTAVASALDRRRDGRERSEG